MNKTELEERIEHLKRDVKLSDDEAINAAKFIKKHRKCKTICQSLGKIQYVISFHTGPIGSFVKIQCEKCHGEEDISGKVRGNW